MYILLYLYLINHFKGIVCHIYCHVFKMSNLLLKLRIEPGTFRSSVWRSISQILLIRFSSHRSRTSDHAENGDPRLHASSHPGDAGELWRTGGSRGRRKRRARKSRGGRNGSPESVAQIGSLTESQPHASLLGPLPLHLRASACIHQSHSTAQWSRRGTVGKTPQNNAVKLRWKWRPGRRNGGDRSFTFACHRMKNWRTQFQVSGFASRKTKEGSKESCRDARRQVWVHGFAACGAENPPDQRKSSGFSTWNTKNYYRYASFYKYFIMEAKTQNYHLWVKRRFRPIPIIFIWREDNTVIL